MLKPHPSYSTAGELIVAAVLFFATLGIVISAMDASTRVHDIPLAASAPDTLSFGFRRQLLANPGGVGLRIAIPDPTAIRVRH